MASYTYIVQHTMTFEPYKGSQYNWELDILRGYEGETAPDWATNPPTTLIGTGEPVEIEWLRDRDVYKPIQGSKLKLNLWETESVTYPNFSAGGQFEYQVRLRYRRDGESTLNDYWCGFINAIDSESDINRVPRQLSFTATDGIGRLEDSTVRFDIEDQSDVVIFEHLLESLFQTGLELPVYVDSGIRNAQGDALVNVSANSYSLFTSEEENISERQRMTRKELIEGLLSAFNCKIVQSYGRWYIFNSSTHLDDATWNVYTIPSGGTAYSTTPTTATESLLYNIDNTSTRDMACMYRDLKENSRRPYGSVECRPQNVVERNYVTDGCFDKGTSAVMVNSQSIDQTLNRIRFGASLAHPNCRYGLDTLRNRFDIGEANDIWFETVEFDVDPNAPIEVNFDWIITQRSNQDVYLTWAASLILTTGQEVSDESTYSGNPENESFWSNQTFSRFNYNFKDDKWETGGIFDDGNKPSKDNPRTKREISSEAANWIGVSETLGPQEFYDPADSQNINLSGRLKLTFFYLRSKRSGRSRWEGNDDNRVGVAFTNLRIQNVYSNEITNPVLERVQENYTTTLTYEPFWYDEGPSAVYNVFSQEGFWRRGQTSSDSTSLARIITQQKLNDFALEFKYFEGSFMNLNTDPIGPHHKARLDLGTYQSIPSRGTSIESCILNGGRFMVKSNIFDLSFYVPDQTSDIAPGDGVVTDDVVTTYGFFDRNINLVPMEFTGRTTKSVYWLGLVVNGLNDAGGALQVPDSMGRNPGDAGYVPTTNSLVADAPNSIIRVVGEPGDVVNRRVTLESRTGYIARQSNMSYFDGTNATGFFASLEDGEDTAEAVSNVVFTQNGDNIDVSFDITIPDSSEFEQIHIAGEVDALDPDASQVDVSLSLASTSEAGIAISNPIRIIRRQGGSPELMQVLITAPAGQLWTGSIPQPTVTVTSPSPGPAVNTVVGAGTYTLANNLLIWTASVTPSMTIADIDVSIEFNLTSTYLMDQPSGADFETVSVDFQESVTNLSITTPDLTGVNSLVLARGTSQVIPILAVAAPRHLVDFDNLSLSTSDNTLFQALPDPTTEDVAPAPTAVIYGRVLAPTGGGSVTVTINGSAQEVGADTFNYALSLSLTGTGASNASIVEASETLSLNQGQSQRWSTYITSTGYNLSASDITLPTGWSAADVGPDVVEVYRTIAIAATNPMNVSETVSFTIGELTREPHSVNFEINSQSITFGGTNMISRLVGYDLDDTSYSFTFDVDSTDDYEWDSSNPPTIVIGTAVNTLNGSVGNPTSFTVSSTATAISYSSGVATVTISGNVPSVGGNYSVAIQVSGEPGFAGEYGLNTQGSIVRYSGTDLIDSVLYATLFVPVISTPVQGRWSVSGSNVTKNTGGTGINFLVPVTAGAGLGFTTPNRTATITHQDNSAITATVTAVQNIAAGPAGDVNADTVGGMRIVVSSNAPTSGTPSSTITFVT